VDWNCFCIFEELKPTTMETSNVNIRYWALYGHIYSYFEQGGNIKDALKKYKQFSDIVIYFYNFYINK
jgi:hypothetical protein